MFSRIRSVMRVLTHSFMQSAYVSWEQEDPTALGTIVCMDRIDRWFRLTETELSYGQKQ